MNGERMMGDEGRKMGGKGGRGQNVEAKKDKVVERIGCMGIGNESCGVGGRLVREVLRTVLGEMNNCGCPLGDLM